MVNQHIITFQSLLKELEKDIERTDILMSQLSIFVSNLSETWTDVSQTYQNMKRDAEKI
jgi:hypothetical protein